MIGTPFLAAGVVFAAAGDWIQVTIWAVVIIIGILNQLFGANNKKKPPQMPRQPGGGAGGGAAPGQKTLLDEVERFLQDARKATAQSHNRPPQQQPRQQPQPQQQQRPQQQVSRSLPSQQKPPKQQKKQKNQQSGGQQPRRDQQSQRLSPSEPSRLRPQVDELEEVRLGSNVGRQAQDHLNTSRFEERAGRLSHLRQTVDADIGGHVHGVFDHHVGSLSEGSAAGTTSDDTPTGPNQVVELVAMLKDPMSMRNAVLMREILEPPSHRW